jgi:hypothetical protein
MTLTTEEFHRVDHVLLTAAKAARSCSTMKNSELFNLVREIYSLRHDLFKAKCATEIDAEPLDISESLELG